MPAEPSPTGPVGTLLMDAHAVARALRRMADQIIEYNGGGGLERLAIVGIHTGGVELARRLADLIQQAEGVRPEFGVLDVSMHRDDLGQRPRLTSIQPTQLPFDLDAFTVVLADDVFYTGRTVRAALDALGDFGRPRRIQLAALVNRGRRELPIRPGLYRQETFRLPRRTGGGPPGRRGVWAGRRVAATNRELGTRNSEVRCREKTDACNPTRLTHASATSFRVFRDRRSETTPPFF